MTLRVLSKKEIDSLGPKKTQISGPSQQHTSGWRRKGEQYGLREGCPELQWLSL